MKNPGLSAVAVMTLALGIGANTAIFSVVNGVLLKPLPYPNPERLIRVFESSSSYPKFPLSPRNFMDYREQNNTLEHFAMFTRNDLELAMDDRPERLSAMRVSAEFFETLGFQPFMGREFERQDEAQDSPRVAVLSHALWVRRFNSDPEAVGRVVTLSGNPFTIVGVMPAGLQHVGGDYRSVPHGDGVDLWLPMALHEKSPRGAHFVNTVGRLRAGVTLQEVDADLNIIAARLANQYPGTNDGWRSLIHPLHEEIVGRSKTMLLVLMGAVVFVLLIACVNVANLMLAQSTVREREIAIRSALGAGRWRLVRQLLTESFVVGLVGGAVGLILADWAVDALVALAPPQLPRLHMIEIDQRILGFSLGISLLTGVLFGLAPALQGAKVNINELLKEGVRGSSGGRQRKLRNVLVVAEVALALVLLIGAGLLMRSFLKMQEADAGFKSDHVLTVSLSLPGARYNGRQTASFYDRLLTQIGTLPGVESAGASSDLPWTGYDENAGFAIEGKTFPMGEGPRARYHQVTPGYFETIDVPLLSGRPLDSRDVTGSAPVVLVNQSLARRYWPDEDAVGKRLTFARQPREEDWLTVVGIVGDVKDFPNSPAAEPAFYWAHGQQPARDMMVAVRATTDVAALADKIRSEVRTLDKDLAVSQVRNLDAIAESAMAGHRFTMLLFTIFAGIAAILAGIGIYGVMAYLVAQRTHEIGIRIALGAKQATVLKLVVGQGMTLTAIGVVIGLAAAFVLMRFLTALLFEVSVTDPATFGLIAVLLSFVALMSCYLPARRAANVDPMKALRTQ
jgi:predicted permease